MLGLQFCGLTGLVILTVNLLKYLRVLKIEGEIALLSLDCTSSKNSQKKRFVRIVRFLYHVKRIINSAYIFFFLWCFSISYKDINFCTRLLRRLDRIGEQWTFFLRLCPLFCEYNCLSFKKLLLRVFFLRCHLIFQSTFIWSTYMEYVSLPVKFASLL